MDMMQQEIGHNFINLHASPKQSFYFNKSEPMGLATLTNTTKKTSFLPIFVLYDSGAAKIGSIVKNRWHLMGDNPILRQAWRDGRPVLEFQRRPNLTDMLFKTKQSNNSNKNNHNDHNARYPPNSTSTVRHSNIITKLAAHTSYQIIVLEETTLCWGSEETERDKPS